MMFKVPRPSRSNGVRLHTLGDHEIGIEYTEGEPHVGKLAYDSACGIETRNITFRRHRPDFDAIVADAVRKVARDDAMPRAGMNRSKDMIAAPLHPDIERIVTAARRKLRLGSDAMPNVGYAPHSPGVAFNKEVIKDDMNDDNDDTNAAMAKVLEFLENIVSPDDLEIVQALFLGAADVDEAREQQAVSRRDDDRRTGRQAADAARRRPMSGRVEEEYAAMFPHANRLV